MLYILPCINHNSISQSGSVEKIGSSDDYSLNVTYGEKEPSSLQTNLLLHHNQQTFIKFS